MYYITSREQVYSSIPYCNVLVIVRICNIITMIVMNLHACWNMVYHINDSLHVSRAFCICMNLAAVC